MSTACSSPVLGGCGAWPAAGQACSGYLVEHDGFRLLMDPGYAVAPLLDPLTVDAVFVSHGHPDHCADLNPLLRARALAAAAGAAVDDLHAARRGRPRCSPWTARA